MSENFKFETKIEFSPKITISDVSGNIAIGSLALVLGFFIALVLIVVLYIKS